MPHADLAITNARLVASAGTFRGSLTVTGERITGVLAPRDTPKAARVIDAEGRYVFPGVIFPALQCGLGTRRSARCRHGLSRKTDHW